MLVFLDCIFQPTPSHALDDDGGVSSWLRRRSSDGLAAMARDDRILRIVWGFLAVLTIVYWLIGNPLRVRPRTPPADWQRGPPNQHAAEIMVVDGPVKVRRGTDEALGMAVVMAAASDTASVDVTTRSASTTTQRRVQTGGRGVEGMGGMGGLFPPQPDP